MSTARQAGPTGDTARAELTGAALCLLSAAGFGAMAIFGKLAYEDGVGTLQLLLVRFAFASVIFAAILAVVPGQIAEARRAALRAVMIGLALGAVGYATQAGLYFAALRRMDASLLALVLYSYPAWVTLAAFALGRERPDRRRVAALALASAGLAVVLLGAGSGALDAAGVAMGLGAALAYTVYILVADRTGPALPPLVLSALVCAGATLTFALAQALSAGAELGVEGQAWLWLALIAIVSTALPIVTFFAGLARVGPSAASILSTFEPVVTVGLAYLAFGERLSAVQLAGAVLVLAAAMLLAVPPGRRERVPAA
jgi:drug/metabolite transporter (DMT)-like permease